jgi:CDP-diacylglycerol--serine O-phosphatidyltransferase
LGLQGLWDALILNYFVLCGIGRLARFNVTAAALSDRKGKVKYYEGTPIPTSIIIVIILGIAFWLGRIDDLILFGYYRIGPWVLHPFTILYAVSGSAMISSIIRIPKP